MQRNRRQKAPIMTPGHDRRWWAALVGAALVGVRGCGGAAGRPALAAGVLGAVAAAAGATLVRLGRRGRFRRAALDVGAAAFHGERQPVRRQAASHPGPGRRFDPPPHLIGPLIALRHSVTGAGTHR
jgi:hypothetical protein